MDLGTLTVPQLKNLCKERKIKGYSKLGRPALLQLLAGVSQSAELSVSKVTTTMNRNTTTAQTKLSEMPHDGSSAVQGTPKNTFDSTRLDDPTNKSTLAAAAKTLQVSLDQSGSCESSVNASRGYSSSAATQRIHSAQQRQPPTSSEIPVSVSSEPLLPAKRHATSALIKTPPPKRLQAHHKTASGGAQSAASIPSTATNSSSGLVRDSSPSNTSTSAFGLRPLRVNRSIPNTIQKAQPSKLPRAGNRFKPLILTKPLGASGLRSLAVVKRHPREYPEKPLTLTYLDFKPSSQPLRVLQTISLPPSLAQRKRVQCWAIILAGISDLDRGRCVLVSRMFRYAVYLSAAHILQQRHGGKRLDHVIKDYSISMTNMWPYLRLRDTEAVERKRVFDASCLGKLAKLSSSNGIAERLFSNPDSDKQLVIATRFLLTRYWFMLSIAGRADQLASWSEEVVLDTQEVIPNEIWSVTIAKANAAGSTCNLYVLEGTCEVVGYAESSSEHQSQKLPLRADWSAYIHHRRDSATSPSSLYNHIKWDGYEEYEKGISRLWLSHLSDSDEDKMKLVVARRYVFACVVGNSVSGSWRSTSEMAQEFAGLSAKMNPQGHAFKDPPVNLYLPEHHHVESVHFRISSGEPLHPALAAVQTPRREYLVLKDNGFEIGNEEHGVYEAWMEILSCNSRGMAV